MLANQLSPDFKEFLELLNAREVQYLVVGGYAVAFHGYVRATGDIDIWIKPQGANARKMVQVVRDFGFGSLDYQEADFMEPDTVIQFGVSPIRIDVLHQIDGVHFDAAFAGRQVGVFDGVAVNMISLHDLRTNKAATGRLKDQLDLQQLPDSVAPDSPPAP